MADRSPRRLRSAFAWISGGLLFVSLLGAVVGVARSDAGSAAPAPAGAGRSAVRTASQVRAAAPAGSAPQAHAPLSPSTPLWVSLPSIRVRAPLLGLGMDGRRPELPPFSMPSVAGWLRDTTTPGAAGPAVLVGHVDTTTGPAVFWKLSTLHRGAAVQVGRLDGHTAEFTVDTVRAYPRKDFPAAKVYGPNPAAVLRIVTCGGGYDRRRHEYAGNTILFAHLTGVR